MKNDKEKYREHLMSLAREGKLSIMQGWDLDYQCLPTNDGKGLIFALGVGCSACFTPEEWHSLLDEVYASNPVYSARPEEIVAIPYEDEDGWTCVRFELRENSQRISREEVMDKYVVDDEKACSEFTSAWMSAFKETSDELKFYTRLLRKDIRRLLCYLRGGKRPRYYHTGIEPKRQNRTRKKQRLTRLQRRWKRQRR